MTTVSTTVPDQGFTTAEAKGQRWFGATSGVLFVLGWIASLLLPSRLAPVPVPFPNPMTSSSQDMLNYYAQAQTTATVGSIVQLCAAFLLLCFTAYVVAFVRRLVGSTSVLPWLALAGGGMSAAFLALSTLLTWALAQPDTVQRTDLVRAFYETQFLAGGAVHVAALAPLVGAASLAAWQPRVLPRWVVWVGLVAAVLTLLSILTMVWLPASFFILGGRIVAFAWILAVSVAAVRDSHRPAAVR